MKDNVNPTGKLKITLRDSDGNIKEQREVKNLVVNAGKEFIASRMNAATMSPISHMAVGSGSATAIVTDTTLGTQISRVALTSVAVLSRTLTFTATFPAGVGSGALTEAGLFNAASGGTMLARTTFGVFNKQATDVLTIEWDVTIN
jgi:hypothetical protein